MKRSTSFESPTTQEIDMRFGDGMLLGYEIKTFRTQDCVENTDSLYACALVAQRLLDNVRENKELACILKYVTRKMNWSFFTSASCDSEAEPSEKNSLEETYLRTFDENEEQKNLRKRKIEYAKLAYIFNQPSDEEDNTERNLEVIWNPDFNIRMKDSLRQQEIFMNLEQNPQTQIWSIKRTLLKTAEHTTLRLASSPNWKEAQALVEMFMREKSVSDEIKKIYADSLKEMRYYVPPLRIDVQSDLPPRNERENS